MSGDKARLTRALVLPSLEHLRRCIPSGATEGFHVAAPFVFPSEAKVAEFDATTLVQEYVFELEVAVDDIMVVQIRDTR